MKLSKTTCDASDALIQATDQQIFTLIACPSPNIISNANKKY